MPVLTATSYAQTAAVEAGTASLRVVGPRDTLMSIARDWSATTGASLAQSMYGIYRANPQAFGPKGMNELLLGASLQLPEAAQLQAISRREALAAVNRELGIWVGVTVSPAAAAPVPEPASEAMVAAEPSVDERLERLETELLTRQRELEAKLAVLESRPAVDIDLLALLQRWWLGLVLAGLVGVFAVRLWRRASGAGQASVSVSVAESAAAPPVPAAAPVAAPAAARPPLVNIPAPKILVPDEFDVDELEGDPPPMQDVISMLHLARAYLEMGNKELAAQELRMVLELGDEAQRREAEQLLAAC